DVDRGLTLLGPFVKRGLPVKLSFAIAKTTRRLKEVIDIIIDERKKLVKKHQLTDVEGNTILDENGNVRLSSPNDFTNDFDELMKQETDVDVYQIDYESLIKMKDKDGKTIQTSPEEMEGLLLLKMVRELEPEKEEEED
ncbi:hypothetical protein LCGC14_2860560, partial [marine sediment metagenome]